MASQYLILLVIVSLVGLSCTGPIWSLDNQYAVDNYYTNDLLGLTIVKPNEWYRIPDEKLRSTFQIAFNPLFYNNESLRDVLNRTSNILIPLFGFSKYQLSVQNGKFNPYIIGFVTRLRNETAKESECESFIRLDDFLDSTILIKDASTCFEVNFNGKIYYSEELYLKNGNKYYRQTQYVRRKKNNYVFTFSLFYDNKINKIQLDNIMNTLKFSDE
ncbi:unnamed protein product [Adineta steineri]|uniref:Uncharacterized protein n=1 Tax=Adineta steineri TaxID=433720 RepID=A0A819L5T5_9BILA|nr:unnamed protein product [Adineta steineri]CAF3958663.1 unnamed protein product [Adineta steineri]